MTPEQCKNCRHSHKSEQPLRCTNILVNNSAMYVMTSYCLFTYEDCKGEYYEPKIVEGVK